jgi:hypothetical protein
LIPRIRASSRSASGKKEKPKKDTLPKPETKKEE